MTHLKAQSLPGYLSNIILQFQRFFKSARVNAILTHLKQYVSAVYLAQAVGAIRSFINARWLGPQGYGFWGWLVFIISFGYHIHLGVQEIMLKEIPALQANGRIEEARRSAQLTFSFYSLMLLIGSVVLIGVAFFLPVSTPFIHHVGWVVAAIVLVFETLFYFEQVVSRSMGYFNKIGIALFFTNIFSLVLTCWLVIHYGMTGIYIVAIFTPIFGLIYLHRFTQYPWRFIWAWDELREKIRLGWPIMAMSFSFLAINWVDRLIVVRYLGITANGYYTLGSTLSFLAFLLPKGLADILEPKLHFNHAQEGPENSIRSHFWMPLCILAWVMPLFLLLEHVLLPFVLRAFLPDYLPGLMAMRVLLWTSYLLGIISLMKSSLVALGCQLRTIPAYLIAILMNSIISLWMVRHGYGVAGITLGSACAFGMISIWLIFIIIHKMKQPLKKSIKYLLEMYVPFLLLSIPCLTHAWFVKASGHSPNNWVLSLEIAGLITYISTGSYRLSRRVLKYYVPLEVKSDLPLREGLL